MKKSQLEHGLKHGDYQRYRQYCAKRLNRIRKALGYVQASAIKNRMQFSKKPVTTQLVFDSKKNEKDAVLLLYIPMICAERAWAYAMQLKQEIEKDPRKRYHMIRRFRKAVVFSDQLKTLCNSDASRCDARTKLETTAYADYLRGIYFFEVENWAKAAELLKKSQTIYEQLLKVINDEELLGIYKQRIDEIKPTLRYCAFNIGDQSASDKSEFISKMKTEVGGIEDASVAHKIEQLINQTREKQSESLSEVVWLGKTIFIKHETIRSFLAQLADDAANDWNELSTYETLIFECRDCLQLLRDNNLSDKSTLYLYLSFIRSDLIIKRNLRLIETLTNPLDILRQYEIIIGSLNEIKSLNVSQLFNDYDQVERFNSEIDARIVVYKAHRCYYIGHVPGQDWKESVALLHRSSQYAQEAIQNEFVTKQVCFRLNVKSN